MRRVERFPMPVCTCTVTSTSESSVSSSPPVDSSSPTPWNRFRHALGNVSGIILGRESLFTLSGLLNLMGFVLYHVPSTVGFLGGAYALWYGFRERISDCEIMSWRQVRNE